MGFIDCYLRSLTLQAIDMLAIPPLLAHAFYAVLQSELADNTAALAGLASALTSLVKRAVQYTKAATANDLQAQKGAAAAEVPDRQEVAAACFPVAVPVLVGDHLRYRAKTLAWPRPEASPGPFNSLGAGSSSSSSSSQAAASTAFLATLLVRHLLQLADAMEAAGPQLCYKCLMNRPSYMLMWQFQREGGSAIVCRRLGPRGGEEQHTVEVQWQYWQQAVLQAQQPLFACMRSLGMAPAPAAATTAGVEQGPAAQPAAGVDAGPATDLQAGDSAATDQGRSSSSSNHHQQVKWGYLLRLQQASPRWAAAVVAFDAKWPGWEGVAERDLPASATAAEQLTELYRDAAGLCRTLAAAAPITVVCNNPSCEILAGVSEAAASCKACAGCSCRYCSVACQRADWKRHKQACRQLAAAGYKACQHCL
jgi:hypothetical protein